ncbi:MAG TPA: hypothetical protein VF808_04590 [Ktedonobacterales bacterium]
MTPSISPRSPTRARPATPPIISLTLAAWRVLLVVCPRSFRAEFSDEMEQVFRTELLDAWRERRSVGVTHHWLSAAVDIGRGAIGIHLDDIGLHYEAFRRSWIMSRMRSSAITMFSAYIALVITGIGFQKLTEDIMKYGAPAAHPGIRIAYDVIVASAVFALVAVVVGGAPIAWASIRDALATRKRGVLALWAVPPISLLIWIGWTAILLNAIWPANNGVDVHHTSGLWLARSWVMLFLLAALASVTAVAAAVSRSDIKSERYRFALRAAIAATVGMFATLAGVAAFTAQVQAFSPNSLGGLASPLLFGESTGTNLLAQIVVMLVATVVAGASVYRGLTAPPESSDRAHALA